MTVFCIDPHFKLLSWSSEKIAAQLFIQLLSVLSHSYKNLLFLCSICTDTVWRNLFATWSSTEQMPLLTSCAGLWPGPFLCSCLHGTKRPTERTRYALNTAALAYILNTVHKILSFTCGSCRCIYLSERKQYSLNFIAVCLGVWVT